MSSVASIRIINRDAAPRFELTKSEETVALGQEAAAQALEGNVEGFAAFPRRLIPLEREDVARRFLYRGK